MEQLASHWADFRGILYLNTFFFKYVDKIQFLLKSDNSNGRFA